MWVRPQYVHFLPTHNNPLPGRWWVMMHVGKEEKLPLHTTDTSSQWNYCYYMVTQQESQRGGNKNKRRALSRRVTDTFVTRSLGQKILWASALTHTHTQSWKNTYFLRQWCISGASQPVSVRAQVRQQQTNRSVPGKRRWRRLDPGNLPPIVTAGPLHVCSTGWDSIFQKKAKNEH